METIYESGLAATDIFRTFTEGKPDLVDLGIGPVSRHIGGIFPGNIVVIGAGQNVGKTSLVMEATTNSPDLGGVISLEDGKDVWGARLLAKFSGVPPTRIRKKELTSDDLQSIQDGLAQMKARGQRGHGPLLEYRLGGTLDSIEAAVANLAEAGARYCVLDYLQKVRGHHADRRSEVGQTMVSFQRYCAEANMVPVIMSQIVRLEPGKEPFPHHLKESGDIENEARLIILVWRDPGNPLVLRGKVAKSSFGGGGLRFAYQFTTAEYLVEYDEREEDW